MCSSQSYSFLLPCIQVNTRWQIKTIQHQRLCEVHPHTRHQSWDWDPCHLGWWQQFRRMTVILALYRLYCCRRVWVALTVDHILTHHHTIDLHTLKDCFSNNSQITSTCTICLGCMHLLSIYCNTSVYYQCKNVHMYICVLPAKVRTHRIESWVYFSNILVCSVFCEWNVKVPMVIFHALVVGVTWTMIIGCCVFHTRWHNSLAVMFVSGQTMWAIHMINVCVCQQ